MTGPDDVPEDRDDEEHRARVRAAMERVIEISAELLRRLADR